MTQPAPRVLVVGAGPTGLVLALWLTRLGVQVRIIDKTAAAAPFSRALGVQARTLEFYRQLGIDRAAIADGAQVQAVNFWVKGIRVAHFAFAGAGDGLTPYPFILDYAQNEHERMLNEALSQRGVNVERSTELLGFEQTDGGVRAQLKLPDGSGSASDFSYIAGCDGAHSRVREVLGIGFEGGTYSELFYVADVDAIGPVADGEVHVDLDRNDLLAVFAMKGQDHVRVVGTVLDEATLQSRDLTFEDVSTRAMRELGLAVSRVNWFSTYCVHHRVADSFSQGRAFLLGDAAHIHSPVGAQGVNTGIGDAINLAWKLAAAMNDGALAKLLDTYETERIGFARTLVSTTDRIFSVATKREWLPAMFRTTILPLLVPILARSAKFRRFAFKTVSQIDINYRTSPLSSHDGATVSGGDRLPWVAATDQTSASDDNFAPLSSIAWQVHVYGEPHSDVTFECQELKLPLHVFAWSRSADNAGLVRDAAYLVRPDGYIALADSRAKPDALRRYFAEHYANGSRFGDTSTT